MEKTIDIVKKEVKLPFMTLLTILIGAITSTAGIIVSVYAFKSETVSSVNDVKSDIVELKNTVEMRMIVQQNQRKSDKNDASRDSANTSNQFIEIKQDVAEIKEILLKNSPYRRSSIASN